MDLRGLTLGTFQLEAPIARGGMGEVWRARHAATGLAAAVKVVSEASPRLAAHLHAEIRAAAALSHRGIVRLYDAGTLSEPAAGLPAGAPWLAMELLEGGTLTERSLRWPDVRAILGDLLDALAHAHARGVLHRDLKPDNVLFDAAGQTRLVDFGVGVRLDEDRQIRPSGTPLWMAPEQFERGWHQLGPWTDLYALGCVAHWMATGQPPYRGDTPAVLRHAHVERPIPALDASFPVPDGFAAWVARAMAKSPRDRWRRAADARAALDELPDPSLTPLAGRSAPSQPTLIPSLATLGDAPTTTEEGAPLPPPLPPGAAGLGLVRLREAPLSGRDREQALLLRLASEAATHLAATPTATPTAAVILAGPSGSGKTRLAAWLCQELHASGAATPFRAAHAPGHGDGLSGVLARALRLDGTEPMDDVRARIEEAGLPSPFALAEVIRASPGGMAMDLDRRCRIAADALHALAEGRLPLLWVDDAQWAPEACALTRHWRGLVVLSLRTDVPQADDLEIQAVRVDLAPLRPGEALDLASGMAAFDADTRRRLVEHVRGSPLFLVELVGEWIGRGLLRHGRTGWHLAGDDQAWPADLPALWRSRLLRVIGDDPAILPVLARAAALGAEVDAADLAAACDAAPDDVVGRLLGERLATPDPAFHGRRWSFVHGSLREAVLELAREQGLYEAAHRACAAMLAATGPAADRRRARHLEEAGDLAGAVDAWLSARAWLLRRDVDEAAAVADEAERLLRRLPHDVRRQGELWIARARIAVFHGDIDLARSWAARALASPDRQIRALGAIEEGRALRLAHEPGALPLCRHATDELRAAGDREQLSFALGELALALREAGDWEQADGALAEGIAITADPIRRLELQTLRASMHIVGGRFDEAIAMLDAIGPELDAPDRVFPRAQWLYHRAYARAAVGAWVGAEADVSAAVRLRYAMNSRAEGWVHLWADMLVMQGRTDEAAHVIREHDLDAEPMFADLQACIALARADLAAARAFVRAIPPRPDQLAVRRLEHLRALALEAGAPDLADAVGALLQVPA